MTHCESADAWYEVDWYETSDGTQGDLYGAEYPAEKGTLLAFVTQASDGPFRFQEPESGKELGYRTVTGDVANVRVWP